MSKRIHFAVGGLIAWTLFVWIGRLRNIFADESLAGTELAWRVVLAGSFTVVALAALIAWAPSVLGRRTPTGAARTVPLALAGFTIVVWAVRWVSIVVADHSLGFTIVHTVLAVVSAGLSVAVIAAMRRAAETSSAFVAPSA